MGSTSKLKKKTPTESIDALTEAFSNMTDIYINNMTIKKLVEIADARDATVTIKITPRGGE